MKRTTRPVAGSGRRTKKRCPWSSSVTLSRRRSRAISRLSLRSPLGLAREQHPDAGEDQEDGEAVEHPFELGNQLRAEADHDRPQDQNAEDAPEEHPVLVGARNGEEREDGRDDEQVVDREALFNDEGGNVFEPRLAAELDGHEHGEGQSDGDIEEREEQALARPDLAVATMQHPEVEGQQPGDEHQEAKPHPDGMTEKRFGQHALSNPGFRRGERDLLSGRRPPDPRIELTRCGPTSRRRKTPPEGPGPRPLLGVGGSGRKTPGVGSARKSSTAHHRPPCPAASCLWRNSKDKPLVSIDISGIFTSRL